MWQEILQRNNLNPVELRDVRYDQIVHLVSWRKMVVEDGGWRFLYWIKVSTAVDAKAYYSRDNNKDRTEEIPEAAELDRKTRDVNNEMDSKFFKVIETILIRRGMDIRT